MGASNGGDVSDPPAPSTVAFWVWTRETDGLEHDAELAAMLCLPSHARLSSLAALLERFDDGSASELRRRLDACVQGGAAIAETVRLRRDGRSPVSARLKASALATDRQLLAGVLECRPRAEAPEPEIPGSETLLRDVAENIPGAIFRYRLMADGSDLVEYMSTGCERIWEISADKVEHDAAPIWRQVDPEDLPAMQGSVQRSATMLTPWSHVWRITTPSGQRKWLEGRGRPEALPDGSVQWNSLILDVTDKMEANRALRRAKEEAELANQAKTGFLANMSHELRTPLNSIIGFADVMRTEAFGPHGTQRYKEYSQSIHASAMHLHELLGDLIDVSMIESGTLPLREEPASLADALRFCREMLRGRTAQKRLAIRDLSDERLPMVFGDPTRIKQVLLNVLGNAVKFTPEHGSVTIDGRELDSGFGVRISDTGPGIPDAEIDRVAQAFVQVGRDAFTSAEGVGLGLYICKRIMDLMGGRLIIESEAGQGTRVTILFPSDRVLRD